MNGVRIIIVGAGKVGFTLAEHLCEQHEVIIIDRNEAALRHASDVLDVMCIKGSGVSPVLLKEADAPHADLVLAATSLDAGSMHCSLIAMQLGA